MENFKIHLVEDWAMGGKKIYISRRVGDRIEVMFGDTVTAYQMGEAISDKPTLRLSDELLQELANALDKAGFKPKEGYLEGKLTATEKHLEDMRTLVFEKETINIEHRS